MEAGINMGARPPPPNAAYYANKPLPPLPPVDRRPMVSTFSSKLNQAFTIPKSASHGSPLIFEWEEEAPGRPVRLHHGLGQDNVVPMRLNPRLNHRIRTHLELGMGLASETRSAITTRGQDEPDSAAFEQVPTSSDADFDTSLPNRHTFPKAYSGYIIPTVPPDEILSPQPKSSVQKILRLTGNMSPTTSLSTDIPSLHNSPQKIRQLTGLDISLRRKSEVTLHPVDEESVLRLSSRATSASSSTTSTYSQDFPTRASCEPPESVYSPSPFYAESFAEINTPLSAPRYAQPPPPPRPPRAVSRLFAETRATPSSVANVLRLSGFVAADVAVMDPSSEWPTEQTTPTAAAVRARRKDSWYHHHHHHHSGDAESSPGASSSPASSASLTELDLEPTAGELYHDTAISIARDSSSPPPPGHSNRRSGRVIKIGPVPIPNAPFAAAARSSSSRSDSVPDRVDSPSSARSFSLNPFRRKSSGLSERRARARATLPAPLDDAAAATSFPAPPQPSSSSSFSSSSTAWKTPQRTPYPPVSSTIRMAVEEAGAADDGRDRFSLLSRIFTGGAGVAPAGKRGSAASGASSSFSAGVPDSHRQSPTPTATATAMAMATSAWSPDTPSSGGGRGDRFSAVNGAAAASSGVLSRTLDQVRQAAGMRSRAEKAEQERKLLRGRIKVLRAPGDDRPSTAGGDG